MLRTLCTAALLCGGVLGCAGPTGDLADPDQRTVERFMHDPAFQEKNLPIRVLRVVVLAGAYYDEETARDALGVASRLLKEQVGVELVIVHSEYRHWQTRTYMGVHAELERARREHPDADVAIGFFRYDREEDACDGRGTCIIGLTLAARNIAVTTSDYLTIVHEFGHVLMPLEPHAPRGIMTADARAPDRSAYFTLRNREIILREKWRDLNMTIDRIPAPHKIPR